MSIDNTASLSTEVAARHHWMSVLARADEDGLEQHLKAVMIKAFINFMMNVRHLT